MAASSPNGGGVIGPSLPEHIDHVLAQSFLLLYSKAAFSIRVTTTVGRDREFYCKEWTWSHGWTTETNFSAGNLSVLQTIILSIFQNNSRSPPVIA